MNLSELAGKHGTDKGIIDLAKEHGALKAKAYTVEYERVLADRRLEPLRILEIGVKRGASLRMWRDYFPNAQIVGLDIEPGCARVQGERIAVVIGDQMDAGTLEMAVHRLGGAPDFVCDDGGHRMEQHRATFAHLFPHLAPGGIYAIEDLQTCYAPEFGGGYRSPSNTMEWFKEMLDSVVWSPSARGGISGANRTAMGQAIEQAFEIARIQFSPRLVLVWKAAA